MQPLPGTQTWFLAQHLAFGCPCPSTKPQGVLSCPQHLTLLPAVATVSSGLQHFVFVPSSDVAQTLLSGQHLSLPGQGWWCGGHVVDVGAVQPKSGSHTIPAAQQSPPQYVSVELGQQTAAGLPSPSTPVAQNCPCIESQHVKVPIPQETDVAVGLVQHVAFTPDTPTQVSVGPQQLSPGLQGPCPGTQVASA